MLSTVAAFLPKPFKALAVRFDRSPIDSMEALIDFDRTRASYVAQTSLYGYLKTRMGTRYREFFEDDVFSVSIRMAAAKLFVSCLGDLTVFSVALTGRAGRLDPNQAAALARHCFVEAMERTLADMAPDMVPGHAIPDFAARCAETNWANSALSTVAFSGSEEDIVRFAPVVDEFKALDREIVSNSIRFRWRDVREQLRKRLDAEGVRDAWLSLDTSG